jgi:hypothetical protein
MLRQTAMLTSGRQCVIGARLQRVEPGHARSDALHIHVLIGHTRSGNKASVPNWILRP